MSPLRWRRARHVCTAILVGWTIGASHADDRVADTRRFLDLLTGARIAYSEAFEDGEEELVALDDLEEARLLVTEARSLNDGLRLVPDDRLSAVARGLESHVGNLEVTEQLDALAADVTAGTGIKRDRSPPALPSATRGRGLFGENCAGCHGAAGTGDGPDAARAKVKPADFTNLVFMRRETPVDFFDRITLGHRRRGMPEWSALGPQQRWDLVAYVWTFAQSDTDRAEGARLWADRCVACHGTTGGGTSEKLPDFARPGRLDDRTDRALFVTLSRGKHAATVAGLTDAQRWRLVGHVRAVAIGAGFTAAPR